MNKRHRRALNRARSAIQEAVRASETGDEMADVVQMMAEESGAVYGAAAGLSGADPANMRAGMDEFRTVMAGMAMRAYAVAAKFNRENPHGDED